MDFSSFCPHCQCFQEYTLPAFDEKACQSCTKPLFPHASDKFKESFHFNQCPHCGAAHLYRQKDFNRKLGLILLILGIGMSFFTYGISLLLVTVFDWFLYKRVGEVGCCYQCKSQFRNSPEVEKLDPFDLELHDYYQNLS